MALSAGTRLGPYEILAPLGAGGMGEVYRAKDSKLERHVAGKVLPEGLAGSREALPRFAKEARAVAALLHANTLALFDVGEANGVHYAVSELPECETLRAAMAHGPMPPRRALEIAREVVEGRAAAHEKGIIHRDVKPENVFLTKDGHAKVLDFGLARQDVSRRNPGDTRSPTLTAISEKGVVLGTVASMRNEPPELSESGRNVSPALDRVVGALLGEERRASVSGRSVQACIQRSTLAMEQVLKGRLEWSPP